jgi:two-component system phosphate regulon response regulator OmpR
MVVEDDDDLREVLCETLDEEGFEPIPHKDPGAALQAIVGGTPPAAIILDYGLPGIGGAGFLSQLRASDQPWSDCPILLLTGWENIDSGRLAVDAVMAKPPEPESLVNELRDLLETSPRKRRTS